MIKYILYAIIFISLFSSCRKAIEPLDFNSNPIDPASGNKIKMVAIDSIISYQTATPYSILYFHVNAEQIPKSLGTPINIDVYFNRQYKFSRAYNAASNFYSFYIYGTVAIEYGFIITSIEKKPTDLIIPTVP